MNYSQKISTQSFFNHCFSVNQFMDFTKFNESASLIFEYIPSRLKLYKDFAWKEQTEKN